MASDVVEFPIDYTQQYVAYLDILGFSDLTFRKDSESRKRLKRCVDLVYSSLQPFAEGRIKAIFVSDSIILSIPFDEHSLIPLCRVVEIIQNNLLKVGFTARGGISVGEAQIDPKEFRVFGPAYIQAFSMEKCAVYPRVIIDPTIVSGKTRGELLRTTCFPNDKGHRQALLCSTEEKFSRGEFLKSDHYLFVDYLARPVLAGDLQTLDTLYDMVKENLASPKPWAEKYQWMKDYAIVSLRKYMDEEDATFRTYFEKFSDL